MLDWYSLETKKSKTTYTLDFSEREAMISKVGLEQITLIAAKELKKFWTSAQSKGIPKQKIVKTSNTFAMSTLTVR